MEGSLWKNLGVYHVRKGEFDCARSVYEEGLESVRTVRDFGVIFDEYASFEESVVEKIASTFGEEDNSNNIDQCGDDEADDLDILVGDASDSDRQHTSVELALARAEHLMERRPLLLNRVLLRQNPHNVGEWLRRASLYQSNDRTRDAVAALEEAVTTVKSREAVNGNPCELWMALAKIHEDEGDLVSSRKVFCRVCVEDGYYFVNTDDLAQCHAAGVEMELRHDNFPEALRLARQSVAAKTKTARSLRLWNLVLDLEESLGTLETTRSAYERVLHMKIATPQMVLNYASFLIDHNYFEDAFATYEKGVSLFSFTANNTAAVQIWKTYLDAFIKRYKGTKLERTRDLFERCLSTCPAADASQFYTLYAQFEENHTPILKRVLEVLERMCTAIPLQEKLTAYKLYILKTRQFLGATKTRSVYEAAIAACDDADAATLCLEFSKMELNLGEVERARTVLRYGAALVDPERDRGGYWAQWHDFEVAQGDEETFREMLRVKRSVVVRFSTVNYNAKEMGSIVEDVRREEDVVQEIVEREGVELKKGGAVGTGGHGTPALGGFVSGEKRKFDGGGLEEVERRVVKLRSVVGEEIDLDDC